MSKAAELAALIGSQSSLSNRNMIINGAMQVAQRGDTTGVTDGYGGPDRYKFARSGAAEVTLSQDTTVPSSQGFKSSLKINVTTADSSLAAGDYALISTRLEGQDLQHLMYGTSAAKKVTLQFWVRSPKTGTHIVELYHGDVAYFNSQTYTIASADTWQKVTLTFDGYQPSAIDNDNGIGIQISWWLAAGSTYSGGTLSSNTWHNTQANRAVGLVNVMDSTSNNFYLTGVQLEVGEQDTPFEHRAFADELLRCQRYYQIISDNAGNSATALASGVSYSTTSHFFTYHHTVAMRAAATLGHGGLSYFYMYTQNTNGQPNSITRNGGSDVTSEINASTSSGVGTAGNGIWIRVGDGTSGYADFDAEL